jgi:hypothetical protein
MKIRAALIATSAALLLSGFALAQTNPSTNSATSHPGSGSTGGSDTVPKTMGTHSSGSGPVTETIEQQKQRAERTNQNAIGSNSPSTTPSGGAAGGTTGGSDTVPRKQ